MSMLFLINKLVRPLLCQGGKDTDSSFISQSFILVRALMPEIYQHVDEEKDKKDDFHFSSYRWQWQYI